MSTPFTKRVLFVGLLAFSATGAHPADRNATALPGGASSLTETYDSWQISCSSPKPVAAVDGGDKHAPADLKAARVANPVASCVLAQVQREKDSRQLVLSVEFSLDQSSGKDAELLGTLVLPFGMIVNAPIQIMADDKLLQETFIATCLPIGCLAPVKLEAPAIQTLSSSKAVTLKSRSLEGGREIAFPIQVQGFTNGLKRLRELVL